LFGALNPDCAVSHDKEISETPGKFSKHGIQTSGEEMEIGGTQTKVNDAGMGMTLAKDEVTKVAIIGNQNSLLRPCESKNLLIR